MAMIKLESNDGEQVSVPLDIAKEMVTIKTMLEDLGINEDTNEEEVVPLPNVDAKILKKIIEWADHHKKHPVEIKEQRDWTGLDWHKNEFLEPVSFQLITLQNYLFHDKKTFLSSRWTRTRKPSST